VPRLNKLRLLFQLHLSSNRCNKKEIIPAFWPKKNDNSCQKNHPLQSIQCSKRDIREMRKQKCKNTRFKRVWTMMSLMTRMKMKICTMKTGLSPNATSKWSILKESQTSGTRQSKLKILTPNASSFSLSVNTQDAPAHSRRAATYVITSGSTLAWGLSPAQNARKLLHRAEIWADISRMSMAFPVSNKELYAEKTQAKSRRIFQRNIWVEHHQQECQL
jgi:hypothetical protein